MLLKGFVSPTRYNTLENITKNIAHIHTHIFFLFETGPHYMAQDGLKLEILHELKV
jgi:hypothetical protein